MYVVTVTSCGARKGMHNCVQVFMELQAQGVVNGRRSAAGCG